VIFQIANDLLELFPPEDFELLWKLIARGLFSTEIVMIAAGWQTIPGHILLAGR
jgi:hypothetical protein